MIIKLIFLDYGANVNKQDRVNRWTPLMQETYQSINLHPIYLDLKIYFLSN